MDHKEGLHTPQGAGPSFSFSEKRTDVSEAEANTLKEMRRLQVENKYLKLILDDLHKSIIVGEATLQMELKPPEDIKNDKLLIELTTNTRKIHIKFYELETELDYIHRKISQLTSMIDGNDRSNDRTQEKTNKFTATGRQPKRNPPKTFEQREQSSKIDKDIELVRSVWKDLKEKEIELSASKQEMQKIANKTKEYEQNYEKLRAEHKNLKTAYTTLQKRCNEDNAKHEKLTQKVKQLKTQLRTEKDKWLQVGRDWKYKYEHLKRTIKESTEYSYKESWPDGSVQSECAGDKGKSYIDEKEALELKERQKSTVILMIERQQERPHNTAKIPSHGPTSEIASDGICSEGRRNLSYGDISHVLPHTGSPITFSDKGKETWEAQASKLKEELDLLKKKRNKEKRKYQEDLQRNREQIKQLEEDINELLNRLSSQAVARMTHNNPYITDLNDQNRPTKISERYSELYDIQWTNAFELLKTNHDLSEPKAIKVLLDVLSVSFDECKEARRVGECLLKALTEYFCEDEDSEDVTILEMMRTLKGAKRNIKKMQEEFNQHVHSKLATNEDYKEMLPDIRPYMDECVEICLLMNIQEPPVELRGLELLSGSAFDLSAFQSYTKSGNKIKYIVWPAMYLHQNGPLLRKGVAQGMRDSSNVLRPTDTEHDANKDDFTTEVVGKKRDPARESTIDQVPKETNVDNERKEHKEKRKESLYSEDPHREISLHPSQNKTEKHLTQDGQSDGSPHMDQTETKLPEIVEKKAQHINKTVIKVKRL